MDDPESCRAWAKVRDWNAAIETNIRFLKGEIDETPSHGGPLNDETAPMVPALIELNRHGAFTHDSQPPTPVQKSYLSAILTPSVDEAELRAFLDARDDVYYELGDEYTIPDACAVVTLLDGAECTWMRARDDLPEDYSEDWHYRAYPPLQRLIRDEGIEFQIMMREYGTAIGAHDVLLQFFTRD